MHPQLNLLEYLSHRHNSFKFQALKLKYYSSNVHTQQRNITTSNNTYQPVWLSLNALSGSFRLVVAVVDLGLGLSEESE